MISSQPYHSTLDLLEALRAENNRLRAALKWYVENDDVNLCDPENQFWIDGYERAKALIQID